MTEIANQSEQTSETKKTTFLTDETFELLKNAQKQIQETTGFSPTMKLLINDTVNNESVTNTIKRFEQKLKIINE